MCGDMRTPKKREFTRRQMKEGKLKQSRIDLVLVQGETISYIDGIRHQRNSFSDHDGVRFGIKVGGERWVEGCGY